MSKQCKSLNRAIKRGHALNLYNGTYKSKKENTIMKQIWKAALKRQQKQLEETTNGAGD